jgi:hypothetical protein
MKDSHEEPNHKNLREGKKLLLAFFGIISLRPVGSREDGEGEL